MNKCFIFRDHTNNDFYSLHVKLDRHTGAIYIVASDVRVILGLSTEETQNFTLNDEIFCVSGLLKMLKTMPERRCNAFRDWFEFQILPRIIDEFNSFTPNDALYEINDTLNWIGDKLEEIKELLGNEQR